MQLEQGNGVPRNPFTNADAMVVTAHLVGLTGDASGALRGFLRAEDTIGFAPDVAASEAVHATATPPSPTSCAALPEHHFRQCSLAMSCEAKQINAVMPTCGTYDAAGDLAYRVGLPARTAGSSP